MPLGEFGGCDSSRPPRKPRRALVRQPGGFEGFGVIQEVLSDEDAALDAILRMAEGWPEPGPYFGRDAVMREYKQLRVG
jgi:hypothetical protein